MSKNTKKIIIKKEHELTDIIKLIAQHEHSHLIITITEPSDLLISPVNFKVLQNTADEKNNTLVFQIIENLTGIRNAKRSDCIVVNKPGEIAESIWNTAETQMNSRIKTKSENLSASRKLASQTPQKESALPQETDKSPISPPKPPSDFHKKVTNAIKKSHTDLTSKEVDIHEENDFAIALDADISNTPVNNKPSLTGKSIRTAPSSNKAPALRTRPTKPNIKIKNKKTSDNKFKTLLNNIKLPKNPKVLLKYLFPLLAILILVGIVMYKRIPLVHVKIYIDSQPVSATTTFTGNPSTTAFNLEEKSVRVKRESVTKNLSDNTASTGTDFKGSKAEGIITFKCGLDSDPVREFPAGTKLVSNDGLEFKTVATLSISCPGTGAIGMTASAVGPEYNLSSGNVFNAPDINTTDLEITNETIPTTGGSKEEITIIAQADVNKVSDSLQESAYHEAENELEDNASNGWVIIKSSITNKIVGGITTDYPIGTERDLVNVELETISEALYYNANDFENIEESLLVTVAEEENLFDSENAFELHLDPDFTSDISIKSIEDDIVSIELKLSGRVKPIVDKENITNSLQGLGWDRGIDYLNSLDFVAKNTEVKFTPSYFPNSLRHFPSRQGRILVALEDVETETSE